MHSIFFGQVLLLDPPACAQLLYAETLGAGASAAPSGAGLSVTVMSVPRLDEPYAPSIPDVFLGGAEVPLEHSAFPNPWYVLARNLLGQGPSV